MNRTALRDQAHRALPEPDYCRWCSRPVGAKARAVDPAVLRAFLEYVAVGRLHG